MSNRASWVAGFIVAGLASSASAAVMTFNVNMTGAKEAATGTNGGGDPDGSAVGTLTLNSDNNTVTWNLTLTNIDPPTGNKVTDSHIHTGTATQNGGVLIPFGVPAGSLNGNTFAGSVTLTGQDIIDLQNVMANPAGYYYNLHNQEFPAGAVRDQVPEPGGLALIGLAGAALVRRRRGR
jgi:hypothetical protein